MKGVIIEISAKEATEFLLPKHYSGRKPQISKAFGWYDKLVDIGGAGATVPLPSFGNSLAKAVKKEVDEIGLLGAFTGGIKGAAAGITASIFFGYLMAIIFNPKTKK